MFWAVVHKSKRVDTSRTGGNSWMLDVGPLRCWKLEVGGWMLDELFAGWMESFGGPDSMIVSIVIRFATAQKRDSAAR